MKEAVIVAFAGQISSGKSTMSKLLANKTGWNRHSFGDYVRDCATRINLNPDDRETLQDLGACLSKRPDLFVRGFLAWAGISERMIIDGVRHLSVAQALQREVPGTFKLVFVDTPVEHAERRTDENLKLVRTHVVEADIEVLKQFADWILADSTEEALLPVLEECGVS